MFEKDAARFSRLRKNVGVAAKLHQLQAERRGQVVMVTLTYAEANAWKPRHVSDYIAAVRKWFSRLTGRSLAYVWVAEIQVEREKRTGDAVLHYHVCYWLPKGVTMPKADKRGWWPYGLTRTEVARKPVAYLMKYASKFDSKQGLPHGARIYGVGGLVTANRGVRRWVNWPAYVQARAAVTDCWRPRTGGGWADAATGEWLPAEWGMSFTTARRTVLFRVRTHDRPLGEVAGPFSWITPDAAPGGCLH